MSRRITTVELRDGSSVHLRVLNCIEYFDLQDRLDPIRQDEDKDKKQKVKEGFAEKLSACVCDESGERLLADAAAALMFMGTLIVGDLYRLTEQIEANNGIGDEELEETEKK